MVAATNAWMLAFDNLSHLPPWLSDALCRLATGGGFGTRALFTNQDEALFDAQRPVLLTGIDEVVTRGDLLDRSLLVYLPEIPDKNRRPEDEFWQAFEVVRPRILGALLDAVSAALRHLPTVQVSPLPRMADFAKWATAAAPALGWEPQVFLDAYVQNRDDAHALAVEGSAVAQAVHTLAGKEKHWGGTATELLVALKAQAVLGPESLQGLPKNARALSAALRRLAPDLRALGVTITFSRDPDTLRTRRIDIQGEQAAPSAPRESR
jgi:putative DNA primase/helicase